MRSGNRHVAQDDPQHAAGNGLLDRRTLFRAGAAVAASAGIAGSAKAAGPLQVEPWMRTVGAPFTAYGQPSHFELHAWLFRPSPDGILSFWNRNVSC